MQPIFVQLDSPTIPALARLLRGAWTQEWEDDFFDRVFRWRYVDRPFGGGTWLALDGPECVAVIDSYLRPYSLDGQRVLIRETADWFCLPKYRPVGLGLKLLRLMMQSPEPIIAVGGTDANRSLLPRLGWQSLAGVQKMMLPVTLCAVVHEVLKRNSARYAAAAKAIPRNVPGRPPRKASPPPGRASVEDWDPSRALSLPIPQANGLHALIDCANLDWIFAAPRALFRPLALAFRLDGEAIGFSLSQLEPSPFGTNGRIVHLEVATPAQSAADWIIAETARRLSDAGADTIRCRASVPQTIMALQKARFAKRPEQAFW